MGTHPPTAVVAAPLEEEVANQHAYLALARRLRQLNQPICGLWPFPASTAFEEIPRQLARALASLGVSVGLVAPPARWRDEASQSQLSVATAGDGIDLLTPVLTPKSNLRAIIEETLTKLRDRYACILLDLSGLDIEATHEVAMLPGAGIALFVAAGQSNELALAKIGRRLPPERLLGAVLMDGKPRRSRKSAATASPPTRSSSRGDRRRPRARKLAGA
jgi:hypothetical protein